MPVKSIAVPEVVATVVLLLIVGRTLLLVDTVVSTEPVSAGKVSVLVPASAGTASVIAPDVEPLSIALPPETAPVVVIADAPLFIAPKPDVILPEFNAPVVTMDELPAMGL